MKYINVVLKKTVFLCVAAGFMLAGTNAYAQREAMTDDVLIDNLGSVTNTGTDVMYADTEMGGGLLQVMVADAAEESRLYWNITIDPTTMYPNYIALDSLEASVSDPDVVIRYFDGSYYAFAVYIKENKQVG